jgi:hypothetical protein
MPVAGHKGAAQSASDIDAMVAHSHVSHLVELPFSRVGGYALIGPHRRCRWGWLSLSELNGVEFSSLFGVLCGAPWTDRLTSDMGFAGSRDQPSAF